MINNDRKKILLMGHVDGIGGAQTAFRKLYEFSLNEGYSVKIIAITDEKKQIDYLDNYSILDKVPHHAPSIPNKIFKWFILFIVSMRTRSYNPDIFVTVGLSNSANFISRFIKDNCYTIGQDFIANRLPDDNLWKTSKNVMDALVVQSPSMLQYWRDKVGTKSTLNYLPCFPEDRVPGIFHKITPTGNSFIRLAYFGRLASNKGLPLLLNALASMKIAGQATLDLWGTGNEENALKELAKKLKLGHKINFAGKYPAGEEGARLITSYDAIILCSTGNEGLPLILLEAMAYGVPFLATDVGAIQDCCIDNPDVILVQPTQDAINAGMYELCQRLMSGSIDSIRLRRYYETNFSHSVMAARWRECLTNPKLFFNE